MNFYKKVSLIKLDIQLLRKSKQNIVFLNFFKHKYSYIKIQLLKKSLIKELDNLYSKKTNIELQSYKQHIQTTK